MEWYWIVLIAFGAFVFLELTIAACMFLFAFGSNRRAVDRLFAQRQADPAPLVRMRFDTKSYMDAIESERLTLLSRDGLKLSARFFPNGGTKKAAVILHGWHSFPWWDYGKSFDVLYNAGFAVLAVSQRAQGESEGKYLTYGAKESEDLIGWLKVLTERLGEDARIAIMGVSMGAATVLIATGKELPRQVKCAVSDCSFTSVKDQFRSVTKNRFPISRLLSEFYARMLARMRYSDARPIDAVKRSQTPTLFIHGEADDFVPYAMMQQLFDASAAPEKSTWTSQNAIHAEAAMTNPEQYADAVLPFLFRHLGEN
ncbi:MAG: alpha/beta fold hydrolase [Clostridia bacterium]|nr:alpha/beta fold hydrolase [Clostridia bacterium]